MKKWMLVVGWMAMGMALSAQTFSEWFRQHKTQIKYLHQQIAALQALTVVTEAGYAIIGQGTDTIGAVLQQDQDQHAQYFASLRIVKPVIERDARIAVIRSWQQAVQAHCKACRKAAGAGSWLDKEEREVVERRLKDLEEKSEQHGAVLDRVLANGYLAMTDDERLRCISDVYGAMKRLVTAVIDFRNLVDEVIIFRQRAIKETEGVRLLYGIRNDL